MSEGGSPFEHVESFEAGEVGGGVQLGRFEAHYEEMFAEAIEDGVITAEERQSLDRTARALGLDPARITELESALQASYEARQRVRVRDVTRAPDAPWASIAPFAEVAATAPAPISEADPRVAALEARVADLEAEVAMLRAELEEAREHVAVEVDLSGVPSGSSPASAADDPDELIRRLRPDPRDPDLLRALLRALGRRGEIDRQECVAHALAYLGQANAEELALADHFRGDGMIKPRSAMAREAWWRLLFSPEEEPLVGEIFSVVVGPVLLGRISALRRDKALVRLDPARRQDPVATTLQAVRCFAWGAAILGMPLPPTYVDPDFAGTVEVVPAVTPSLRLGRRALSGRTPAELAFLAGRELSFFREDHFVRALLPSIPDLEDIFLAALSIGNPGLPLAASVKARVAPIAQAIEPILDPPQIDRLRGQFLRFVEEGGRTNLQRWASAVDSTAHRAGFLLAGDLAAAEAMITLRDPLEVADHMDDLLVFITSDRYARLRAQLGLVRDVLVSD